MGELARTAWVTIDDEHLPLTDDTATLIMCRALREKDGPLIPVPPGPIDEEPRTVVGLLALAETAMASEVVVPWMVSANPAFDGARPIDLVHQGDYAPICRELRQRRRHLQVVS